MRLFKILSKQNNRAGDRISRNNFLSKIYEYDIYWGGDQVNDNNKILQGLKIIGDELNLQNFIFNLQGDTLPYICQYNKLSQRQNYCLKSCLFYIQKKEYGKAYHELCDFISDYNNQESFLLEEIICISIMTKLIKEDIS